MKFKNCNFILKEWRHAHGMRCLGIPNTAHFANVTQIEDALGCKYLMSSSLFFLLGITFSFEYQIFTILYNHKVYTLFFKSFKFILYFFFIPKNLKCYEKFLFSDSIQIYCIRQKTHFKCNMIFMYYGYPKLSLLFAFSKK